MSKAGFPGPAGKRGKVSTTWYITVNSVSYLVNRKSTDFGKLSYRGTCPLYTPNKGHKLQCTFGEPCSPDDCSAELATRIDVRTGAEFNYFLSMGKAPVSGREQAFRPGKNG